MVTLPPAASVKPAGMEPIGEPSGPIIAVTVPSDSEASPPGISSLTVPPAVGLT